ncbi:MAG: hypothetical protein AAB276_06965 [Pseudomonadota bacterium]
MSVLSSTFANNANPKMDAVAFVLNQVHANVGTSGHTDTPKGTSKAIEHGAGALGQFQEAKKALAAQLPENAASASAPNNGGGSAMMRQLGGAGMVLAAGAIAGPVAAAVVGAITSVYEGAQFFHAGTTHAAIDGGVGEMGLGEMTSYKDTAGDTYSMAGQPITPPKAQTKAASQPLIDPAKMSAAADAAFEKFTPDQIRESIGSIGKQEKALVAELGANFRKMGIHANVGETYSNMNADILDEMDTPKPDAPKMAAVTKPTPAVNMPLMRMG